MSRSPAILAVLLLALPLAVTATDLHGSPVLSLGEALSRTATGSEAASDREIEVASSQIATRQAHAELRPSLTLSGGFTARDNPVVADFSGLHAPLNDDTYWQGLLQARYLIWDGGVRSSSIAAAQAAERVAARSGDAAVVSAQLQCMAAYIEAMIARAQQDAVAKRITAVQRHLEVVQDLLEEGLVARNDLLATEVRLRSIEDHAQAAADLQLTAQRRLKRIMGEDPDSTLALPERLPTPPPLIQDRAELITAAVEANPQVRATRALIDAAAKQEELQQRIGLPHVFTSASHTYEQNPHMVYNNANILFLGVSWDIYDGGIRSLERERSALATSQARRAHEEAKRIAANGVDQAFREYLQAQREAKTAQANVSASEENLRIEEDQYRAGLTGSTDVLDAEALLAESRFTLVAQHYAAYLQQARLLALAGVDLAEFYRRLDEATNTGESS